LSFIKIVSTDIIVQDVTRESRVQMVSPTSYFPDKYNGLIMSSVLSPWSF